jgi:hypothetical protein
MFRFRTPLLSFLCSAFFALGGCAAQAPFVAKTDCAKLVLCGQCASRGGCFWCGVAGGAGGGQCLPMDASSCGAPQGRVQTPDQCAPPPVDADFIGKSGPAESKEGSAPETTEEKQRSTVRTALTRAFPRATVTSKVLDGIVRLLLYRGSGPNHDGSGREVAPISKRVKEREHRLYLGDAIHYRVKGLPPASEPMLSEFMMTVPMVRVSLPQQLDRKDAKVQTEVGVVDLSADHLLGSIALITEKYGSPQYLGYRPARVDLITPARRSGSRFAAIAVYLGYRAATDRTPSFYLLEAGTATGEAKMIYFSPNMKPIPSVTSYYLPTPFVSLRNTYSGVMTMRAAPQEDEPDRLVVRSYAVGQKEPYITVSVKYQRAPVLDLPAPIEITADAGARVALIARTMGLSSAVELQTFLSNLGRNLSWREVPHWREASP